jgi:hypothetical protein
MSVSPVKIKLPTTDDWIRMDKDKDYFSITFYFLCAASIIIAVAFQSWGIASFAVFLFFLASLYRAYFLLSIKPSSFYKEWRKQIISRKDDQGIEINLGFSAFKFYFPNGNEEDYLKVINLLLNDKSLGILIDSQGRPYYIGN